MSPNRKAELQRKLTLAPIPKPPAGLADRIKNEIPKQLYFDTELERRRFSQQAAFNLRVAAAILLLIGSSYLALHVLSRAEKTPTQVATATAKPSSAIADIATRTKTEANPQGFAAAAPESAPAVT